MASQKDPKDPMLEWSGCRAHLEPTMMVYMAFKGTKRLIFEHQFDVENRQRKLEGAEPLTRSQFWEYMKSLAMRFYLLPVLFTPCQYNQMRRVGMIAAFHVTALLSAIS